MAGGGEGTISRLTIYINTYTSRQNTTIQWYYYVFYIIHLKIVNAHTSLCDFIHYFHSSNSYVNLIADGYFETRVSVNTFITI
jgi:uncharacterized membrane protein YpjA